MAIIMMAIPFFMRTWLTKSPLNADNECDLVRRHDHRPRRRVTLGSAYCIKTSSEGSRYLSVYLVKPGALLTTFKGLLHS